MFLCDVADGLYQNAILLPVSFNRRPLVICSRCTKGEGCKTANTVPKPLQCSIIPFSNEHILLLELLGSDLDGALWRFSLFANSK